MTPEDTDGDSIPDFQDDNSDGDTSLDIEENGDVNSVNGSDADQDGLDDNFDSNNAFFDVNDEVSSGTPENLTSIFGDADGDLDDDGGHHANTTIPVEDFAVPTKRFVDACFGI